MRPSITRSALAAGLAMVFASGAALAQSNGVHEEILGVDPARDVVAYIERSPSALMAFPHVTLVEVARDGTPTRIRLTTDEDVNQCRSSHDAPATRGPIDARVLRDIETARARFQPASVLPVSQPLGTGPCARAPFARSEASLPDGLGITVEPTPDGASTHISITRSGRAGPSVDVPSVILTQGSTSVHAPYDRIADVREIPGVEQYALLLRSDACTPEGQSVPVRLVRLAAPPYPEIALHALVHAELAEREVIHAVAPHATRRTLDEVTGWYDRRARVVYDNGWALPLPGDERFLVQYTRIEPDMPPPVVDAGQAYAQFALFARDGSGHLRLLSQLAPPMGENVFEGTGQEAFAADLNGDGLPEVIVRSLHQPGGEIATVLNVSGDSVQFVWRGQTMLDERTSQTATNPNWRHCDLGLDGTALVLRCRVATYRPNARTNDQPLTRGRIVQRLHWNGGVATLNEERR